MDNLLSLAVWGGFAASLILIGHWFPWRALLGRDLRRLEAYTYGVVVIALAAIIPLTLTGNYYAIAALVVAIASAGAATLAAYAIDGLIAARHDRLDVEDAHEHAAKRHSEFAEFTD